MNRKKPLHVRTALLAASLAVSSLASAPFAAAAEPKEPAQAPPSPQLQASQAEARRLSDAFVDVAERVSPSVVQIDVTVRDERRPTQARCAGSGAEATRRSSGDRLGRRLHRRRRDPHE